MMKNILLTGVFCAITAGTSHAFTVQAFNGGTFDMSDFAITDDAGVHLADPDTGSGAPSATVSVGFFSSFTTAADFNPATLTPTQLLADFQQHGSSSVFNSGDDSDGFYNTGITSNISAGSSFIGQTVHTLIQAGSQFLVYRHDGTLFAATAVAPAPPNQVNADVDGGTLLLGNTGPTTTLPQFTTVTTSTLQTVNLNATAVPEPSSIALLGLGVVGFVIRRRR